MLSPRPLSRSTTYALIASVSGLLFGFDASVISGVAGLVARQMTLTDWQQGVLVSAPTFTALFSALCVGPISDRVGRKRVLGALGLLYAASATGSALAPTYSALVAARAVGGLAFGSLVVAPLYIAEIAPPARRGRLVSLNQLNIVLGFLAAYATNYVLLRLSQSGAAWTADLGMGASVWRWMLGVEVLPALGFWAALQRIPESPRWLLLRGRAEQGRAVLAQLVPPDQVARVVSRLRRVDPAGLPWRLLLTPSLRVPLAAGLIVAVAQQATGVNAVYFYAPAIFEQSGIGTSGAFASAVGLGLANVAFTVAALLLIDRVGRRPLLVVGLVGVVLSMSATSAGFYRAEYTLASDALDRLDVPHERARLEPLVGLTFPDDLAFKAAAASALGQEPFRRHEAALLQAAMQADVWLIGAGLLGFVASFALSLGPVTWVLLSELFPTRVRGLAVSLIASLNSLVSFGVQVVFPWEVATLGAATTFLLYGVVGALALGLVVAFVPETRGRALDPDR